MKVAKAYKELSLTHLSFISIINEDNRKNFVVLLSPLETTSSYLSCVE